MSKKEKVIMDPALLAAANAEQQAVVESRAQVLVVDARAGSGKTTTLVKYAEARPEKKITYVVFNAANKKEAEGRFPGNVSCKTGHGLAYKDFGVPYQHKLGSLRAVNLARDMGWQPNFTYQAIETLSSFLCSVSREIEVEHVPLGVSAARQTALVNYARTLWARMQDVKDMAVPMTHDGYLKLYHLSNPIIKADIILLDEAQDLNPVLLDIVQQQSCRKVFVGDTYQAIYSWRGAINAMSMLRPDEVLHLKCSFRFGSGIANLASALLADFKGEKLGLMGLGVDTTFKVDRSRPHAIIGRTNSGLFDHAVNLLNDNRPFAYVGGVEGYRIDTIANAYALKTGQPVRDPALSAFGSWEELEQYVEETDDVELKTLHKIVKRYGKAIPTLTERIKKMAARRLTGAEVLLTTAHKSKGLEFDSVVLLDDFVDLASPRDEMGADDIHLLYVALTRARKHLELNDNIRRWAQNTGLVEAFRRNVKPGTPEYAEVAAFIARQ